MFQTQDRIAMQVNCSVLLRLKDLNMKLKNIPKEKTTAKTIQNRKLQSNL